MYVCNCNGVNERRVDAAIRSGARKPAAVHRACGVAPQCGRCLADIAARIRNSDAIANSFNGLTEAV
ncbi:MAG: bacterioferritin-associated ferredoxin [Hyphomonadaceae bacterium]